MNTIFPGVFHVSQKQGVENEKHFNLRQSLFVFQKWPTEKKIIKKERNVISMYSIICNVKEIVGKRKIVHCKNHLNYCIFLIILL